MLLRHICEVCGKQEVLTPEQGFEQGWEYPPQMGEFRIISPRTCGGCGINDTLWWLLSIEGKQPADLNDKQLQTLNRILHEPESTLIHG